MPAWTRRRGAVPLACGLLALTLTVAAALPSLRPAGWSLTVLPRVAAHTLMAAAAHARDPGFRVVPGAGYDGQFYWGVAVDPVTAGNVHQGFDKASYRYGHPLYGWLGWLGSAGQARAAPAALFAVGLLAMLAAAVAAALLGRARGRPGWEGLAVALNPGLLYAGAHDLAEPLAAALLLGGLLAYVHGRRLPALACFALLPLTKEELAVVPLAVAAWELWRRRTGVMAALPYLATLVPALVWWSVARIRLGAWFTSGSSALGTPLAGWARALLDAGVHSYVGDSFESQLGQVTGVVVVALLALLAIAAVAALRLRGPVDAVFVPLVLVAACLAPNATVLLRDALRNTALLLVLVPFVIVSPPPLPTWTGRRGADSSPATEPSPT